MQSNELFTQRHTILLDGGMGTMLQAAGLKLGARPEELNITNPELIESIHAKYAAAGSRIVNANTFGASAHKLAGSAYSLEEIIAAGIANCKRACAPYGALAALDVGPLGELLEPNGTLAFEDAVAEYGRIVRAGVAAGADLVFLETFTDLYELKAALLAVKENSSLPVLASMSFEAGGRTFTGCTVESFGVTARGLGASAVGINCSLGPKEILPFAQRLCRVVPAGMPVFVKPNAGLPNLDGSYDPAQYTQGMELDTKIVSTNDPDTGCVLLSKKAVDEIKEADKIVETIRNGESFEITIDKPVKGGLLARLGTYSVFIPASQIKERFVSDLKQFAGKKLEVVALEIDDAKHKIVASRRKLVEAEKAAKEEVFWAHVVPNVVVSGVVKRITPFGAFVSVDGFDCLAHIVDLSWNHIKTVDEVLTVGQTYDFLVLSADKEKKRVSLGYKQLQPHPFVACMEKHPVGSTLKGKVVSIVPFGVFVEVEPHIEGLVHVSEVAHSFVKDINEVVKVGDEVEVKVLNYDEANKKINLSMKACLPEEPKPAKAEGDEANKKTKKVKVDIYFTAVGLFSVPTEKEMLSAMEEIRQNPQQFKTSA